MQAQMQVDVAENIAFAESSPNQASMYDCSRVLNTKLQMIEDIEQANRTTMSRCTGANEQAEKRGPRGVGDGTGETDTPKVTEQMPPMRSDSVGFCSSQTQQYFSLS